MYTDEEVKWSVSEIFKDIDTYENKFGISMPIQAYLRIREKYGL